MTVDRSVAMTTGQRSPHPTRSVPVGGDRPVVGASVVGPLEGALAFEPGLLVKVEVEVFLRLGEDLVAPAHYGPSRGEHLFEREAGRHPAVEHGGERRDVFRQERAGG